MGKFISESLQPLLELTRRGVRFDPFAPEFEHMRMSVRSAIMEMKEVWEKCTVESLVGLQKFYEFLQAREISGESLMCNKEFWAKDDTSQHCLLCAGQRRCDLVTVFNCW